MAKFGKTGVTSDTPKKILFGAGTIHKNVTYDESSHKWNFENSIMICLEIEENECFIVKTLDIKN